MHLTVFINIALCSFSDRVFISDRRTRQLVAQYATKGLHCDDMLQLRELAREHAPCLVKLFEFLSECSPQNNPVIQCPAPWRKLIQGLASSSPVCALLPPNDSSISIAKQMKESDITMDPDVNDFSVSMLLTIKYIIPLVYITFLI